MHASDMLVHVHTRKLSCVLDPALILATPGGIKLALRLTHVVEPWLTRTFWQLIDSSDWLRAVLPNEDADAAVAPRSDVLGAWIEMREQTDAASWPFRWIGDRLAESQLLDHADACLIEHYEALADSLAARAERGRGKRRMDWPAHWDPGTASIDTLPLSAALDAAMILTARGALNGDEGEPTLVSRLRELDILVEQADSASPDSLFAAERALLREALAQAGLTGLCQRLPRLAVVHVTAERWNASSADENRSDDARSSDAWSEARAWWYPV
ncbi:hypothetical protein [Caballeronia sp. SL2Y3]|uniref:hypothetical protein n=1 Tax=Caballeronia sp. SL2Y3 TaxID=2878151 RepID=UPI001FD0E60B|nr:hypothetical protein [Caballeronia sp. SL2Y3]